MLANLTSNQLEFLTTTNQDRRLDVLLEPAGDPTIGLAQVGFETADACLAEDRNRARALRGLKPKLQASIPGCDAAGLASRLDTIADPRRTIPSPPCLASAVYMRGRRLGLLGAVLELVAENPELDVAWITAHYPSLRFDQTENWSKVVSEANTRLDRELEVSGATAAAGFVIAFLTGHFDPRTEKFHLQYRGLAAGDKLKSRRKPSPVVPGNRPHRGMTISVHQISNLSLQISRMLPSFVRERVPSPAGTTTTEKRMREPHHTIYLAWLAQYG